MSKPSRLLVGLCLAVGLLVVASAPMSACMSSNPCAGCNTCCTTDGQNTTCGCGTIYNVYEGPRTLIEIVGQGKIRLTVQGYDTTQLNPLTSCVTAFPPLGSVESVDAVVNYDGRTNQPFEEVSFYRSEVPAEVIAEFAREQGVTSSDEPWYAFQSHITGTVEDGVPNYFVIEMTLREGVSLLQFVGELKQSGQFLTSGSDELGTPNHHPYFREIGEGPLTVVQPFAIAPNSPLFPAPGDGPAELY